MRVCLQVRLELRESVCMETEKAKKSVKDPILSFGLCTDFSSDPILEVKDRRVRVRFA